MVGQPILGYRTKNLCNVRVISKCHNPGVGYVFTQETFWPVYPRLSLQPSVIRIACQTVDEDDIDDRIGRFVQDSKTVGLSTREKFVAQVRLTAYAHWLLRGLRVGSDG